MSDIQFDCPTCATPLVVDSDAAGRLITCPQCGKQLEVPGRMRVPVQVGPVPPITPSHRQEYKDYDVGLTLRTRNCTMAYVSLTLVCLSLITAGLLLMPGLICGHIALGQCNRDPNMTGRSFAVAALAVGYIIVGVGVLILLGLMGLMSSVE